MVPVYKTVVSSKGQLTLPKKLREKYHLKEGEEALLVPAKEGVLIKHPSLSLRGSWVGKIDSKGFEEEIRKIRREWRL